MARRRPRSRTEWLAGMPAMAPVGRDEELGVIDAFLTQTQRGQAALVLAGEAGIGKTTLWAAGIEAAERRLCRVVICRGVEAEATLSFAGLSELLAPVLGETLGSLVQPRRRALEVALLLAEPGEMTPDTHAIGLAVLDVLRVLVERGPVVVAIDDIQWLDPATAAVLEVALRRLGDEPVGLLGTVRAGARCLRPHRARTLLPGGAAGSAVGRSAQRGCGPSPAERPCRARSVSPRAGECAPGNGWQSVLRRRAGTGVGAVGDEASTWSAAAGAEQPW